MTGEKKYLDKTKSELLAQALKFSSQSREYRLKESNYYHEGPRFGMAEVGYDFIYHGLTQRERATIEDWLRTSCHEAMEYARDRTVNPSMRGAQCGEIGRKGCVLGDEKFINWATKYFKNPRRDVV